MRYIISLLLWMIPILAVIAQGPKKPGELSGKVVDAGSGSPLGYTTVQVTDVDGQLVDGTITDENGSFNMALPLGEYQVVLDFMGYHQVVTDVIRLTAAKPRYDLGEIEMASTVRDLDEVVVQAERSTMELALDKRVFNVGKDLGNAGGSAAEILNNVPSVTVDAEGNVQLRGSSNVRILVDGKPSGLVSFKGGSGLQQLQASLVDQVEVITNPSARYEAEGMSGIINIVLKKERRRGFNGSVEVSGGYPDNIGGAANINYRRNNLNFFINYGISYRILPAYRDLYQELYDRDTTFISRQSYDGRHKGFSQNIRGGLDFFFSESSILTASYLFRRSDGNRYTDLRYDDYIFSLNRLQSYTTRIQDEDEVEPNNEYALSYKKEFSAEGHALTADLRFLDNWEDSDQVFTQFTYNPAGEETGSLLQMSPNDETEKQLLFQLDYTYPFGEEGKLEAGTRLSYRQITNDFLVTQQNEKGIFETLPQFDNDFTYEEDINAIYGIYGNKYQRLAWQLGLRAEWTRIETILEKTGEDNLRTYANLFPSVHLTYDLVNQHALQLSYSRRVRRPVYRELNPFITYSDNRNFFSGNPDLNPEFSHVVELGHIKYFDRGSLASALYYRQTAGVVQQIRLVDEDGFSNTQPENLDREDAVGVEVTAGYTPVKGWKIDANFNLFHANIRAGDIDNAFDATTTTWFARQTSRFDLWASADLQFRAHYEAPRQMAQGRQKSLYYFDLAFMQDIWKEKGTLTLNVTDILNSRINRSELRGNNFFAELESQRQVRTIKLTLSYRINQ